MRTAARTRPARTEGLRVQRLRVGWAPGVQPGVVRACLFTVCLLLAAEVGGGCGSRRGSDNNAGPEVLRLGYFPNLTHAQALVGTTDGTFQRALQGKLKTHSFNAGPAAMEALLGGSLDATYIGGVPSVIAYVRSQKHVRVIAGAASGGSVLVARTAQTPQDLKGKKVSSPQLGNSQDVALRHWLSQHGLKTKDYGPGDVTIVPVTNADALGLMKRGELEAAWVPEPWGARIVAETGAHVLVDERSLWPDGKFPTTVLLTTTKALEEKRPALEALLRAHVELTRRWRTDPEGFRRQANEAFGKMTKHPLPAPVLEVAFSRMEPVLNPPSEQLTQLAARAQALGYLPPGDLSDLVDASLLEEVLADEAAR